MSPPGMAGRIDTRDAVEVLYHFCLDPEAYTVTLMIWKKNGACSL